ncbi:MAG: hypothetical protein ACRD3T_06775, partial [Terriglobia bacterium]
MKQWLEAADTDSLYTSVLTFGEIRLGAGSADCVPFKVCGRWSGNDRKTAEFLKSETLRYPLVPAHGR